MAILIGVILSFFLTIMSLFVGNILLFDSITLAVLSGVISHTFWSIHPGICLLIGVAIFLLLFWLQTTKIGFWFISILLSFVWSALFGLIAYFSFDDDIIWGCVIFGLSLIVTIILHIRARDDGRSGHCE